MQHAGFEERGKDIAASLLSIGAPAYGGPAIMGFMQADLRERRLSTLQAVPPAPSASIRV